MIAHLEPVLGDTTFLILDIVPAGNIPQIGSVFSFTVTSWSMFPTIHQGDVLTIESSDRICVGDVIVFVLSGALVCHRVTSMQADGVLCTRGDAANQEDAPIRLHHVIGRVSAVQRGSSRFAPAPSPTKASLTDRLLMRMALLRALLGERLVGWALNMLATLKRPQTVRAVARFFLARHVRFYLGVRAPLQSVQAYCFVPLPKASYDGTHAGPLPPGFDATSDVLIHARFGRHRLGTFHPASSTMCVRRAASGLGLEEYFHAVHRNLLPARRLADR